MADGETLQEMLAQKKKPATITRGLRVEIVKPLNSTWDELGALMRTQRSTMHRLYTAAALAAIEADRKSRKAYAKHKGKTKPPLVHPKTAAYRAVPEEMVDIQDWAANELAKHKKKSKKKKKGEGAEKEAGNQKNLERLAALQLPGGTKSAISNAAYAGFMKWKKDKGRTRVPTWEYGAPIPIRAAESGLLTLENNLLTLKVKLQPKGYEYIAVRAGHGAQWQRLKMLAANDPNCKRGDVKIVYNERKKKWFAIIAFTEPKPVCTDVDPNEAIVLHRGQKNLLVAMSSTGHYTVVARGNKLRAFKERMKRRRKESQAIPLAERGKGSRGHGRSRRHALPEQLEAKEKAFIHTLCQQTAARVVTLAKQWGCGTVYIEDYGGIEPDEERGKRMYLERFPNHEMKECIDWALKKGGLVLKTYDHAYISQTCPRCGNVEEGQLNYRTGVFHCRLCDYERPGDQVSALHGLRRVGHSTLWDTRLKAEEKRAKKLREAEIRE